MWYHTCAACASIHLQPLLRYKSVCFCLYHQIQTRLKKKSLFGEIQHLGSSVFQGSHRLQVGVLYLAAHSTNFQFPSFTAGRQLLLHMQPQLLLCPPSKAFTSRQTLRFREHVGAGVLVSVHSQRLPAHHLQRPEREHSQTAPWKSIFEFHLGLLCRVSNLSGVIAGGWACSWVKGRQTQPHQRGE